MIRLMVYRVGQFLRLYRRLVIALALLLTIYAAVGFWLVPYVARLSIEKYVVKDLHRRVVIKGIRVNPFTLAAEISGFSLAEADNTPIASFDLLRMDAQLSSIVYRAWTFAEVRLERPNLNVLIAEDGSLNLSKLHPATGPAAESERPVRIPPVRIATLSVRDGHIGFQDRDRLRSMPFTTTLAPIEFTLTEFRTSPDFQNAYSFEATTLAGEHLAWSGQFSIQPFGSIGHFQIGSLKATTIGSFLRDALSFDLQSGSLDVQGDYRAFLGDKLLLNIDLPTSKLHDVAIGPKGAKDSTPWISLPSVELTRTSLALDDRKISVEGIQIEKPKLNVWRDADGKLNLANLAEGASTTPSSKNAAGWSASIGTVAIRAASIEAEDRTVEPVARLNIAPADLTISGYSTKPGTVMNVALNAASGVAGRVTARGEISLVPMASNLELDVADFELLPFQSYLAESTALQLTSGKLLLKGALKTSDTSAVNPPHLELAGDLAIKDVGIRDNRSTQSLINWESLQVKGIAYSQNPDRLEIQQVEARRPYARMIISEDRTLNIATALAPPVSGRVHVAKANPSQAVTAAKPIPVRIRSVVIQEGSVDFSDHSVEPNFSATILGLTGGASGLSSDEASRADVKLSGTVDRYAPVDITGRFNLLSAALFTDVAANFHNMELTTFNPYSGKYAGYSISKGKLTTELHYKVENRKLDAQHHIVLDQLEFGAATDSKDKVPLPVRLAAALLKDRHGIIDINLPVRGSLDDPEFRIRPIVWKAFVGLMDKAVTAPFHLLGSLFGRGEEIAFVDFSPGSATLAADQKDKLETLAKGLIERPQLRLDIPLQTLAAADDEALARTQLDAALVPLLSPSGSTAVVTQEQRLTALTQLYQQQFGNAPVFPPGPPEADAVVPHVAFLEKELRPRFNPTSDQRTQLARSRADVVQAAVLANTEIAPERLFLTERSSGKTAVPGTVRMEFSLE
jgi:uncharacterized protein involved in outer membrane biogenesis